MNVVFSSTEGAYLCGLAADRQVLSLSNSMGHRTLSQLYAALSPHLAVDLTVHIVEYKLVSR